MAFEWLSSIKDITDLITSLGEVINSNRATKDLLLRELKLNLKAFQTAQKSKEINYDQLLKLLHNEEIKKARTAHFSFMTIKKGNIETKHIHDERNVRYKTKNIEWLFKNIDEKIEDLRNQQQYHESLQRIERTNISLQFSNLFYKMKLLADFINHKDS
jgi:hypothetical protein